MMRHLRWGAGIGAVGCIVRIAMGAGPATQTKPAPATRPVLVLQADAAEQHGTLYATTRPGYSGSAYVTGIDGQDDHLTWHLHDVAGGIYAVELRYSAQQIKNYDLAVNGVGHEDFFSPTGDAWQTHAGGKVELKAGDNTIELRRGWGYFDIDRIELIPTDLPELKKPGAALVDPQATEPAKQLMQRLVEDYGRCTRSGVTTPEDAQYVHEQAGVYPAIMGGDLMDYSPSRLPFKPVSNSPPERLIADYRSGYLLTVMWHWNAPDKLIDKKALVVDGNTIDASWYRGFYTQATNFDLAAALSDPNGAEYKLLIRDIDAIAVQLKKFSDAGIPVLWRPLHEADGKWFWWGAKGSEPFKQLWSLMFDRLTRHHHLHNLIWVYTGSTAWDWYPPADQFDVIGVDFYPKDLHDPASAIWDALQAHWGEKKLIALTEMGGVPDVDAMARLGVRWSYFASWGGPLGPRKNPMEELKRIYRSPIVLNRGAAQAAAPAGDATGTGAKSRD